MVLHKWNNITEKQYDEVHEKAVRKDQLKKKRLLLQLKVTDDEEEIKKVDHQLNDLRDLVPRVKNKIRVKDNRIRVKDKIRVNK